MYIILYDISDKKILRKFAKKMEDYGIRYQKSVFIYYGNEKNAIDIKLSIIEFFKKHNKDNNIKISMFRICEDCKRNSIRLGEEELFSENILFL